MEMKRFGKTVLEVSEFGLGCARIGGIFQQAPAAFIGLLQKARERGITFFDTADMYSQGESERLIGRAFPGCRRHEIVIATKAGYAIPSQRRVAAAIKPLLRPIVRWLKVNRTALPSTVRGEPTQNFSPAYLRTAIEGSLRRLRTDYLDLFQLHSPPAAIIARADWLDTLVRLQEDGKIRYFGVAVDTVEAGLEALKIPGVASLQFTINLLEPAGARELLPLAHAQGLGIIARECLANGLLVKPENEVDLDAYVRSSEEKARKERQLAAYRAQAAAERTPLASLALAYVRGLAGVSVTLIGARTPGHLSILASG